MATLRGGGGIKVLKMYYVVCDWSLISSLELESIMNFLPGYSEWKQQYCPDFHDTLIDHHFRLKKSKIKIERLI